MVLLPDTAMGGSARPCCSTCAEMIDAEPVVIWQGAPGAIILHGHCGAYLGASLIGDAREARLAAGGGHWARPAGRAVGYGLRLAKAGP